MHDAARSGQLQQQALGVCCAFCGKCRKKKWSHEFVQELACLLIALLFLHTSPLIFKQSSPSAVAVGSPAGHAVWSKPARRAPPARQSAALLPEV
jgi:hypothetical protein